MEEYLRATAIADHMIQASDSLFGWTITRIYVGPFAFSFRAAPTDLRRTSAPSTGQFRGLNDLCGRIFELKCFSARSSPPSS